MRIIHAPTEISGQMGTMIQGLRTAGYTAVGYNWFHNYLQYNGKVVRTDAYELKRMIDLLANQADILHFHNGNSFLVSLQDIRMLGEYGVKMVMHHWGNDVRTIARSRAINPYPMPPSYYTDEVIGDRLRYTRQYIRHAIVQDYELYPHVIDYYEHVHVLPLACDVASIPYAGTSPDNRIPIVIHAPTNRAFKGSEYVEKAIRELHGTCPFTYQAVEKKSHAEAMALYRGADIIIDQILCGTYGMLSVEAMAMGKVVVAYIRDDVRAHFPADLPIVSANPDTLREVLRELIGDPERRARIGQAGRSYVERHHAVDAVIARLAGIYSKVGGEAG